MDLIDGFLRVHAARYGKPRFGLKDPQLGYWFGPVLERYPNARAVTIVRDPRASASSLVRQRLHIGNLYYGAKRWVEDMETYQAVGEAYPEQVLTLQYEEFVRDPEICFERVCAHFGITHLPEVLEPDPDNIKINLHEGNIRTTRRVDASQTEAWSNKLNADECALIESVAGPMMDEIGYARTCKTPTEPGWLKRLGYTLHQRAMTNYWWQKHTRIDPWMSRLRGNP